MSHKISRRKSPRKGSLQYWPRKKAKKQTPSVKTWPKKDALELLGFAGYKAGMAHVVIEDTRKTSQTKGQEITIPVTFIETPPIKLIGFKTLKHTPIGKKTLTSYIIKQLDKEVKKKISIPKKDKNPEEILAKEFDEIKLIIQTQPKLIRPAKKKPDILEVSLGGSKEEQINYVKEHLGKEIQVTDFAKKGEWLDTISVSKGKGFQGSVKRFGVKLLPSKTEKNRRKVGSLGPWNPAKVPFRTPQHGRMGYNTRTEFNKEVISIVNPEDGFFAFHKYGKAKNPLLLLHGSVPGPKKRIIVLRKALRPPKKKQSFNAEIKEIILKPC